MVVRLVALHADHCEDSRYSFLLEPGLEGLGQFKKLLTSSLIEPTTLQSSCLLMMIDAQICQHGNYCL
jgi:hypothetical protein